MRLPWEPPDRWETIETYLIPPSPLSGDETAHALALFYPAQHDHRFLSDVDKARDNNQHNIYPTGVPYDGGFGPLIGADGGVTVGYAVQRKDGSVRFRCAIRDCNCTFQPTHWISLTRMSLLPRDAGPK